MTFDADQVPKSRLQFGMTLNNADLVDGIGAVSFISWYECFNELILQSFDIPITPESASNAWSALSSMANIV